MFYDTVCVTERECSLKVVEANGLIADIHNSLLYIWSDDTCQVLDQTDVCCLILSIFGSNERKSGRLSGSISQQSFMMAYTSGGHPSGDSIR